MEKVYATIITIGDELLIGQVVDTNSSWMAQELNKCGILVCQRLSVGDVASDIRHALDEGARCSRLVFITGGLGPTADDITKPVLCDYFGGKMVMDETVAAHVRQIFLRLNRPITERNLLQAQVPDVCTVIPNMRGTAPGMWFEKNGVVFVSMPGVPHEMKGMMTDEVLPRIQRSMALPVVLHRTLLTAGIGESFLADLVQDWEKQLPETVKLAYLPNYGMVRMRLSASGPSREELEPLVNAQFEQLKQLVAPYLVTDQDEPLESVIGKMLRIRGKKLVTAESCTGGYIAHLITSHPGASDFFAGSVVSYSNDMKEKWLGVGAEILSEHGAVSEAVVTAMARGALADHTADYALAVSGIMGPGGGSESKPVGTVWMAVADQNRVTTQQFRFRFDRRRNIELTAAHSLNALRLFITAND